jgi:hypothetical protein
MPPGRQRATLATRLIPMGVWCDSDRNQRNEKTDAILMMDWRCGTND